MSGHPVDVDADSICWLYVPPKADNKRKHGKKSRNILITRWRRTGRRDPCRVAKQRLNSNKQILPNLPNWVWIISFISGWVLSSLFSVSPHNGNATQLIAIEVETELMFTDRHWLRGQQTEQ
jgi:hypothetical protein